MIKLSTGMANYIAGTGGYKAALAGCHLLLFSAAQPGDANTGHSGLLATIALTGGLGSVTDGAFSFVAPWSGPGSSAGVAKSFRICETGDTGLTTSTTYRRLDGTVTETGGGGDLTVDNASIAVAQAVSVVSFAFGVSRG